MTSYTKIALLVVLIAAGTHLLTVTLVPILIMQRVMSTISEQGLDRDPAAGEFPVKKYLEDGYETEIRRRRGINVALPAPRADARNQRVVRQSPDLVYTVCVFDVSEHPLHVSGPVQDTYVSLSGFAANTDNFFVINDRQIDTGADGSRRFNVVIRGPASGDRRLPPGARVIDAPTDRGMLLFRSLVPSEDALEAIYQFQARQKCSPVA